MIERNIRVEKEVGKEKSLEKQTPKLIFDQGTRCSSFATFNSRRESLEPKEKSMFSFLFFLSFKIRPKSLPHFSNGAFSQRLSRSQIGRAQFTFARFSRPIKSIRPEGSSRVWKGQVDEEDVRITNEPVSQNPRLILKIISFSKYAELEKKCRGMGHKN